MATIYLVRHGQASFGKLNYDQLSNLGHQQGHLVGQALSARGVHADVIVHGDMQRHRETLSAAQSAWQPEASALCLAGFNEFDSDDVMAAAYPEFRDKAAASAWLRSQPEPRKLFQTLFEQAVLRWTSGEHDQDYLESWSNFGQRVRDALAQVMQTYKGQTIVIFTSGGPITLMAQQCLALSDNKAFALNWTLYNGGISQLLFSRSGKLSLASFNEHQHLAQAGAEFLTYR